MLNFDQILKLNPLLIILKLVFAFGLSLAIAWVYKKSHRGLSYSQSFVFALTVISVLTAAVMMVVENSLAKAFTLLGAFTIIRFRTAIKDTRDIIYIFWSLVTGMAVGAGNYLVAVILTILMLGIIFFLRKTNFSSMRNYDHMISFVVDTIKASNDAYRPVFEKYLKFFNLLNVNTRVGGTKLDFTFNVAFLNDSEINNFISTLRAVPGVENINLLTSRDDIEY